MDTLDKRPTKDQFMRLALSAGFSHYCDGVNSRYPIKTRITGADGKEIRVWSVTVYFPLFRGCCATGTIFVAPSPSGKGFILAGKIDPDESAWETTRLTYEEFERLADSSEAYHETEVNGHAIQYAADQFGNTLGVYYVRAGFGTKKQGFIGDVIAYAEFDKNWPYGE